MPPCGVPLGVLVAVLLVHPPAVRAEGGPAALVSGEVRVRAETYEQTGRGHVVACGLVDLQLADLRIQADQAEVIEEEQPDGSTRRRIVAEGNVVMIRDEERLSGDRLELDESGRGTLSNAVGFLESGVFVRARTIERLDADTYRVVGGTFSSCSQPTPRWSFRASRAKVDVGQRITGTNVVFRVKGVPALYSPFVYYPIREDRRSTGFLLPSFGYSADRGYNLQAGFYWAMGRSADQTFRLDYHSKAGYGLGHELRWVGATPSRGTLRSWLFDAKGPGAREYTFDANGLQQLPDGLRATAEVHLSSSAALAQQYQEDSARGVRSKHWSLSLARDLGIVAVSVSGQGTDGGLEGHVDERLPSLVLRPLPSPLWGGVRLELEGSAEQIRYGSEGEVDAWTRYHLAPKLSRPLRLSFLEVSPSVGYHYTRHSRSVLLDEKGEPLRGEDGDLERDGPALTRSFFEASLDVRGPTFARVFDTPGFAYADRFKHTIGPEILWTYRTAPAEVTAVGPSGERDLAGTSRIDYALVQRFYAKRRGPGGKRTPYEFLSWRLAQPYHVRLGTGHSERLGPLESDLTFRPTDAYQLESEFTYDVDLRQLSSASLFARAGRPGLFLEVSWTQTRSRTNEATTSTTPAATSTTLQETGTTPEEMSTSLEEASRNKEETLGARLALELLPGRLRFEGQVDCDVARRQLWQARGLVRYSAQCCGFTVEYNWRRRGGGASDGQWRFSVELANVGSISGSPDLRGAATAPR